MTSQTARREWKASWPLPLVAMFGIAGVTMFPTSSGVFMQPMATQFGWSHAQFSASFLFQVLVGLAAMPAAGRLADKLGARRVALAGIVPFAASFALLGTAGGSIWQWWGLCTFNALCAACVSMPIWLKPVAARFEASRGLALSIALGGVGVSTGLWPLLAAFYSQSLGWRLAYPALALSWALPMTVLTLLFFDSGEERVRSKRPLEIDRAVLRRALGSRTFLCLCVAGGLYACMSYGLFIQLVPILRTSGFGLAAAASLVGLFGMSSIAGRVVIGALLDRLPTRPLSACVFLLPIPATLLLWQNNGSLTLAIGASALFGVAGGGETDILTYLAAKRFSPEIFASVYAVATAVIAMSASIGPLLAGAMFDGWQSYSPFLFAIIPTVTAAAILIALIPPQGQAAPERLASVAA